MAAFSRQLPAGASVLFGTSREQQFNLHSSQTYTGSVLAALGLKVPLPNGGAPMAAINLEQLLALNPQWLLVAHYRAESIVTKWQQDALWPMLQAEQNSRSPPSIATAGRGCAGSLPPSVSPAIW